MAGESDLGVLLKSLRAELVEGVFVFVTLLDRNIPDGLSPKMVFEEQEGTTLIILKGEAEAYQLPYEFPCRMITLNIHSALEAVGFMARIASDLAKHGLSVNPVAGFFHDHLFVPAGRENEALAILRDLAGQET